MLKRLLSLFLAAALVPAPYSCTKDGAVEPREAVEREDDAGLELERIEDELGECAEVRELMGMLQAVAERMEARGLRVQDLAAAAGKAEGAGGPLGYSQDENALFRQRLEALCEALFARYPVLRALVPGAAEAGLGPAQPGRSDEQDAVPLDPPVKGSKRVSCKWGPFVVALLACANAAVAAGGNPGVYFVCAYQVLCSYCQGGWIDNVCS